MNGKSLYKYALEIARNSSPMTEIQQNRLWLAYNTKNLIKINKDNKDPQLIEKAIKNLNFIKNSWDSELETTSHRTSNKFKTGMVGARGWLPGFATCLWLSKITK
jgi:hypothetical protein